MKKSILTHLSILLISFLFLQSCSLIGLNVQRKTPKKGYVYPEFTKKDSIRGALNSFRTSFDVQHYYISIDVQPAKKYIQGFVDIDFTIVEPTQIIQIDLYENMTLDSIIFNSSQLSFSRKYGAVYVEFTDSLFPDSSRHIIRCYYQGKPQKAKKPPWEGGFVWKKAKDKSHWIGVACEVAGASLWWPCKDHISDEPHEGVTLDVTVPKGLQVISNGMLLQQEESEQTTRYVWNTNYPINTYNVTVYIGNYVHFSEIFKGVEATFMLDFYVLPENLEKAKEVFAQTAQVLHFFEKAFGPYPWPKEGFKLVNSPYAGMEHQTAIAYGSDFKRYTHHLGFDYLIVHETAHEWWGNAVSVNDYAEIFIHEGFATYAEALYVEHTYGAQAMRNYMAVYSMFIKNKNPIVGPRDVNFWDYKDSDPYLKGAWVLHGLRRLLENDDLFFEIIQGFYADNYLRIVQVSDFVDYVNSVSGTDYSWYFNHYLYKREVPHLEYNYVEDGIGNVYLYVKWNNVDDSFVLPIRVFLSSQNITRPFLMYPTNKTQVILLPKHEELSFDSDFAYFSIKKNKKLRKE